MIKSIKIIVIILICLAIWSVFIEPNIEFKHLKIYDTKPKGFKLVFASYLHIKPFEKISLKRISEQLDKQNTDIVLLGLCQRTQKRFFNANR